MLTGAEDRPRLEQESPGLKDLQELAPIVHDEFEAAALGHSLDDVLTRERHGRSFSFTRGGVVTHVTTHGMRRRAQCLNMLRHLGMEPLPPSAVLDWMLEGNSSGSTQFAFRRSICGGHQRDQRRGLKKCGWNPNVVLFPARATSAPRRRLN